MENLSVVWTMVINIRGKFMYMQRSGSFHVKARYIIQWYLQYFSTSRTY